MGPTSQDLPFARNNILTNQRKGALLICAAREVRHHSDLGLAVDGRRPSAERIAPMTAFDPAVAPGAGSSVLEMARVRSASSDSGGGSLRDGDVPPPPKRHSMPPL
eukprot:5327043-Prymnesium_polylepis.1